MSPSELRVEALYTYPLKGAGGVRVPALDLDEVGPVADRRWMLVNPEGVFLSQRTVPSMARLRTTLTPGSFSVRTKGSVRSMGHAIHLPLRPDPSGSRKLRVRIWNDEVEAIAPDPEADRWFSEVLERPCRAVFLPESSVRTTDPSFPSRGSSSPGRVGFADGFPLLLISSASLVGLNGRLADPVPMDRFRPNIVVGGAPAPHAEDRWQVLTIGGLPLDAVKQCARCLVPTIDQETGARGPEPNRTLATYRRHEGRIWFGVNLVHREPGNVREGDSVRVIEEGPVAR